MAVPCKHQSARFLAARLTETPCLQDKAATQLLSTMWSDFHSIRAWCVSDSNTASGLAPQSLGMDVAPVLPLAASGKKAMQSSTFWGAYNLGLHAWLQTALGELTFESEAAERLRGQLRAAERQQGALQQQVAAAQAAAEAAQQAEREARAEAERARRAVQLQSDSDRQLQVWLPVCGAASSCAEPLLVTPRAVQVMLTPMCKPQQGLAVLHNPSSTTPAHIRVNQLPMLRPHAGSHVCWQLCGKMRPCMVKHLVPEHSGQPPCVRCDQLSLNGCLLGGCGHAATAPTWPAAMPLGTVPLLRVALVAAGRGTPAVQIPTKADGPLRPGQQPCLCHASWRS